MSGKGKVKPNNQAAPGPIGNTQGLIVPQTQPNASGPGNSAPPPKPTPKEEGWWNRWGSDALHTTLDVVGLIPGVGEVADGANALVYLAEGDKVSAALSAAAMLPIGGQAATAAKMAKKGAQVLEKQAAKKAAEEAVAENAKKEAQAAASGGYVKKSLLLNGPIRITEKGLAHVVERHTVNDIPKFAGKSKFNEGENLSVLINSGTQQRMVQQANGNFARTWDAGRSVGIDRVSGQHTSVMTVITRPDGELVTAFPGHP